MMAADQPPAVETVVVNAARLPTSLADAAFSIVTVDPNALQTFESPLSFIDCGFSRDKQRI